MRNVTKNNITEAFMRYCNQQSKNDDSPDKKTSNLRTIEIMACLAKHLHAFALEITLTHEEWNHGIDFLKQVGAMTTPERDEFVLLSDVLGLSSLVDMIHNTKRTTASVVGSAEKTAPQQTTTAPKQARKTSTSSSVLGPFHLSNPPKLKMGTDLKRDNTGELVLVQGQISDCVTGHPIAGATVNVWQTAPNGLYCSQDPNQDAYNFHGLFASTGEDGMYAFTTAKPVPYEIPTDGPVGDLLYALGRHAWRPSHLHYIVKAEGYQTLVTEIFPDDDPYLDGDAVFGVRDDLILTYTKKSAHSFPKEDFDLSGQVKEDFLHVCFDLVLTPTLAGGE